MYVASRPDRQAGLFWWRGPPAPSKITWRCPRNAAKACSVAAEDVQPADTYPSNLGTAAAQQGIFAGHGWAGVVTVIIP